MDCGSPPQDTSHVKSGGAHDWGRAKNKSLRQGTRQGLRLGTHQGKSGGAVCVGCGGQGAFSPPNLLVSGGRAEAVTSDNACREQVMSKAVGLSV